MIREARLLLRSNEGRVLHVSLHFMNVLTNVVHALEQSTQDHSIVDLPHQPPTITIRTEVIGEG